MLFSLTSSVNGYVASTAYAKGQALCDLFIALVDERCQGLGLALETPRERCARGSHVSLSHAEAYPVMQALIARGVVGDVRAPATLRFGFTPLYTRFEDVWRAVLVLEEVLRTRAFDEERFRRRAAVT